MRGLVPVALLLVGAIVLGAMVFAARWLCLKWLRPTATKGMTMDAIETLRREGHISLEEFARLRRLVLGLDGPAEEKDESKSSTAGKVDDAMGDAKDG